MNQRLNFLQIGPVIVVVLLIAALGALFVSRGTPVPLASLPAARTADQPSAAAFDAAEAAELSAARWLAMARFYEEHDLLTRDLFDYEQAAADQAARWQAMARFYEINGLLNDEMDSGELSAYRWNAMARAYERMGLLNK
jgi:hypothetical protein